MSTTATRDAYQHLIDTLAAEPDPIRRLASIRSIQNYLAEDIRRARNEAAYNARMIAPTNTISRLVDTDRHSVQYWVKCHSRENGLPDITKRPIVDLSLYQDLTDA